MKPILTSMNLYEFSQVNNNEMGIHIGKATDPELYKDICEEAQRLIRISDEIVISVEKASNKEKPMLKPNGNKKNGYCIRTGIEVPFKVEKPMSHDAFKSWSKYEDPEYPEKFCHFSGEPSNGETSIS